MKPTRTAIVTGGERGIGRAIVQTLLGEGYNVSVLGQDTSAGAGLPEQVRFYDCDMANYPAISRAIDSICASTCPLHALVCNAGIANPGRLPIEELEIDDWQRVLDVNLSGPFYCAKAATPYLRKAGGTIVNIASTRALQSEANTFAYSASKGGLVSLTHSLAVSLGPEIRVNAVSPGWIQTDPREETSEADELQHPAGRIGAPNDIAEMVAYLLSQKSGFVTGQNFVVDGGMTKKMIYAE
ncbi:SDR family oxidoreductase [Pelagicoccus enzymogenes]|uniref:SDR family oxidoreductase n=1 Tax=Pelagicoccus enzymogenes TaxID=2773457 RepID=UPI00280D9258|nr:SDR family oxidoreductase [Pelagicoccus enzymogenes]MDQ8197374.1 SDR family oxidoreductase [Pelagicoccus enzymogenes]